ncbi:conserved hypothetical protein, partial [Coccidioides posadasii str. Silveira]
MDAATDSNPQPPVEPPAPSFSTDYWNSVNSIYPSNQPHDQPFGIGWDHPVFQQHDSHPHSHSHPHRTHTLSRRRP